MTDRQSEPDEGDEEAALDPRIQVQLGAKLRSYYDDLLRDPVPDRFIELLQKLDTLERDESAP